MIYPNNSVNWSSIKRQHGRYSSKRVVRALKYPLEADSVVFCGDDAIQAFIPHGDLILVQSEAGCLSQGRLPQILPRYEGNTSDGSL